MSAKNIVRFLKTANVKFSSLDTSATGACEFYRQLTATKTRAINPKAEIEYKPVLAGNPPSIHLSFINGTKQDMEVPNRDVRAIMDDIEYFCSVIETEYEEAGKNID